MSATVIPLERDAVFWFRSLETSKFHAFELVEGEFETLAVCGLVRIDTCEDEPTNEAKERHGRGCLFCLAWGAT